MNDPNLKSEVSFNPDGTSAKHGKKGSIRLDVVQTDDTGKIVKVWDLKTGDAKLSDKRIKQIYETIKNNAVDGFSEKDIITLKPQK